MELPQRKQNRITDYDYSQEGAYFVTICTQDRKRILSIVSVGTGLPDCPREQCHLLDGQSGTAVPTIPTVELLRCGEIVDKYIRRMDAFYNHLSVDKYVIMPDHIHLLITIHRNPERSGYKDQ